ncbi:MAG: ABC transporter permease [Gammaproteobacteria bacterium]|nr:ABC transporter permease [Gammaproteobacteria bacterium]|tara:strand:+ start:937 stop:2379 length:1443 start_codon:yes stop_codon:yes gene_type:complete
MTAILHIARGEWQHMLRTRLAVTIIVMLLALIAVAAASSAQQLVSESQTREAYQREAEATFRSQPARHPHRMVHYGHYVFRTPAPLAVIDPGVDPFTGRSIFLEGHRRNTAAFAEARETSVLTRLGVVSPAFALQVVAPLLLILLGFTSVVRERERGTLLQLIAQGVPARALVLGKAAAIGSVAALASLPLLIGVMWLSIRHPTEALPALLVFAGHATYLGFWVLLITVVSALASKARSALITLIIVWAATTILMPRIAADVAATAVTSQTQTEMDILVQRDMRVVGDSHNINDPGFRSFQDQVLEEYGVDRIEDLPVNYRGLVSLQGEAEGSAVMNQYAAELHATQRRQATIINLFAIASPYLAVRNLSMRSAGTDLINHQRFLDAAEAQRFELIQQINTVHANEVLFADDSARSVDHESEQRTRVSGDFWHRLQDFNFTPQPASDRLLAALPLGVVLALWLLAATVLIRRVARKAGEA